MVRAMKPPIFARSLSGKERERLEAGLRSKDTFTLRRSQMLLASSRGDEVPQIAKNLGCGQQTVRDAIHDFNHRGVDALTPGSSRPKRTRAAFDEDSAETLNAWCELRSPSQQIGKGQTGTAEPIVEPDAEIVQRHPRCQTSSQPIKLMRALSPQTEDVEELVVDTFDDLAYSGHPSPQAFGPAPL